MGTMYGALNDKEIDALLNRHRYGRLGFRLAGEVSITPIKLADTVVIVGVGMIGSVTLQAAKAAGCALAREPPEVVRPASLRPRTREPTRAHLHRAAPPPAAAGCPRCKGSS